MLLKFRFLLRNGHMGHLWHLDLARGDKNATINHTNKINLEVNCCGKWHISCVLLPYTFMLSILYLYLHPSTCHVSETRNLFSILDSCIFFYRLFFVVVRATVHTAQSTQQYRGIYVYGTHAGKRFLHTFTPSTSSNHATQSTVDPVRARPNFHSRPTQDMRLLVWHLSRTNEVVLLSIPSTIASHARPAS